MRSMKRIAAAVLAFVLVAGSAAALPSGKSLFNTAITADATEVELLKAKVKDVKYADNNVDLKSITVSYTANKDYFVSTRLVILDQDIRSSVMSDLETAYAPSDSLSGALAGVNDVRLIRGESTTNAKVIAEGSPVTLTKDAPQNITINLAEGTISNTDISGSRYYLYFVTSYEDGGVCFEAPAGVVEVKDDGIYYGDGKDSGDMPATTKVNPNLADRVITVTAPDMTYTGSAYDKMTYEQNDISAPTPTVTYQGAGDTTYAASSTAPTDPGDYVVTVSIPANNQYKAGSASANFSITAATMTVNATGYTGTYDAQSHEGATVNVTTPATGATVAFLNPESGNYEYATSPKFKDAGTYTVGYKVTAAGYTTVTGTVDVTINKAPLTVTANDQTKVYGEDDPQLTYKTEGLKGEDQPTGALARSEGNNAGKYAITQGSLSGGNNYELTFNPGTLEITQRSVKIVADDKASQYGNPIKELTYTGGDTVLEGDDLKINLTTEASETADAGEYEIVVNWDTTNPNYAVDAVNGKYTLTRGEMDVEASGFSGVYDGESHGINVTIGETTDAVIYYATEELTAENYQTVGSTEPVEYTDAGEYTVYYYVASKNYEDDKVTGSQTITIAKAEPIFNAPAAIEGLKKTGKAQELVKAGETADGKFVYALGGGLDEAPDDDAYSENIPTGTDGGTYYVWYKVIGDDNHNDGKPACVTVTIVDESKKDDDTPEIIKPEDKPENKPSEGGNTPGNGGTNPGTGVAAGLGALALAAGAAIASKKRKK